MGKWRLRAASFSTCGDRYQKSSLAEFTRSSISIKTHDGIFTCVLLNRFALHCLHKPLKLPSKHFNVVSMLFLGWYDVATSYNIKSTLKQRCVRQRWNLQRWTTSMLGNVQTMLSFSTSIYTPLDHVKTTLWIWPLKKWKNKPRVKNVIILLSFSNEYAELKIFFTLSPF